MLTRITIIGLMTALSISCGSKKSKDSSSNPPQTQQPQQPVDTNWQQPAPQYPTEPVDLALSVYGLYQQVDNSGVFIRIYEENGEPKIETNIELPVKALDGAARLTPTFPQMLQYDSVNGVYSTTGTLNRGMNNIENVFLELASAGADTVDVQFKMKLLATDVVSSGQPLTNGSGTTPNGGYTNGGYPNGTTYPQAPVPGTGYPSGVPTTNPNGGYPVGAGGMNNGGVPFGTPGYPSGGMINPNGSYPGTGVYPGGIYNATNASEENVSDEEIVTENNEAVRHRRRPGFNNRNCGNECALVGGLIGGMIGSIITGPTPVPVPVGVPVGVPGPMVPGGMYPGGVYPGGMAGGMYPGGMYPGGMNPGTPACSGSQCPGAEDRVFPYRFVRVPESTTSQDPKW